MANYKDFNKKEPSKNEQMIYQLAMQAQMVDRNLATNSALLCALGIVLDINPEKLAELLINGNDQIKDYSTKINETITKLEQGKQNSEVPANNPTPEETAQD